MQQKKTDENCSHPFLYINVRLYARVNAVVIIVIAVISTATSGIIHTADICAGNGYILQEVFQHLARNKYDAATVDGLCICT